MSDYYKSDVYTDIQEVYILVEDDSGLLFEKGVPVKVCTTLAHIDPYTGKLSDKHYNLNWYPKDKSEEHKRFFYNETIYKVKAATSKDEKYGAVLLEILEVNAKNELLEKFLEEYKKPVVLEDEILGTITLNKDYETFEGKVDWMGETIFISLEVEADYKASWTRARKAAGQIVQNQKEYDALWKEACIDYVLPLIPKWCEKDESLKEENYTREKLEQSLGLSELVVMPSGSYLAMYSDSDLFMEHAIEVRGSIKKGIKEIDL